MKQFNYFHLFVFLFVFVINGCLYEPSAVFYNFILVNNTIDTVSIDYKTIKDDQVIHKNMFPNEKLSLEIMKIQCYQDFYKDSLIFVFFDTLKIYSKKKQFDLDLFRRSNWKEKLNLDSAHCKGGNAIYELKIEPIIKIQKNKYN